MGFVLIEGAVAVQRVIHFLIAGQVLRVGCAKLTGSLVLGHGVVGDAVFGHQLRSLMGELFAHQVAALWMDLAHQNSSSLTVSAGLSSSGITSPCSGGGFSS